MSKSIDGQSDPRRHWLTFVELVAFYTLANHIFCRFDESGISSKWFGWTLPCLTGALAIQPALFGIWLAFGPGTLFMRLPVVVTSLAIAMIATGVPNFDVFNSTEIDVGLLIGATSILLMIGVIGSTVRWYAHIEIVHSHTFPQTKTAQFNIKFLLGLTLVWAIILAVVGRAEASEQELPPIGLAILFVVLSLITVPCLVPSLLSLTENRSYHKFWKFVVTGALAIGLFVWTSAVVLSNTDRLDRLPFVLVPMLTGAAICGLLSANALRRAGYRLARRQQN